jgi:hypothetical protein
MAEKRATGASNHPVRRGLPVDARAVDQIEAGLALLVEKRNRIGWILQVAIHDDNRLPGFAIEAGAHRNVMAESARQPDSANAPLRPSRRPRSPATNRGA